MARCLLHLVLLRPRSHDFKELEIVVLRHELAVLRRQTRRPHLTMADRIFLAAASRSLPLSRWRSFLVTPTTLLRRHRLAADDLERWLLDAGLARRDACPHLLVPTALGRELAAALA